MWTWYMLLSFYSAAVTLLACLYFALRKPRTVHGLNSYKTMIVLGSGGHTAEMFKFLMTLPMDRKHLPRVYVIADNDTGSQSKVEEFERLKSPSKAHHSIIFIPRSRNVGQSYVTSIFTTIYSFFHSALAVWKERPSVLLANGPGTCLPIIFCAWFMRTIGMSPCTIFLLESYACVQHASLTGKLCHMIVDRYCVQWPDLLDPSKKHIVYTGRVPMGSIEGSEISKRVTIGNPAPSYVLVTVGSTLFDSLIAAIDKPRILDCLQRAGFTGIHVQYGKGNAPGSISSRPGFEVVLYDYKKNGWQDEIGQAGLVIGHAGAGTILDCLEADKPIIVVANNQLMNKHQSEIANVMQSLGHLFVTQPRELLGDLPRFMKGLATLKAFPKTETNAFAQELSLFLRGDTKPKQFLIRAVSKRRSMRAEKTSKKVQ